MNIFKRRIAKRERFQMFRNFLLDINIDALDKLIAMDNSGNHYSKSIIYHAMVQTCAVLHQYNIKNGFDDMPAWLHLKFYNLGVNATKLRDEMSSIQSTDVDKADPDELATRWLTVELSMRYLIDSFLVPGIVVPDSISINPDERFDHIGVLTIQDRVHVAPKQVLLTLKKFRYTGEVDWAACSDELQGVGNE